MMNGIFYDGSMELNASTRSTCSMYSTLPTLALVASSIEECSSIRMFCYGSCLDSFSDSSGNLISSLAWPIESLGRSAAASLSKGD